MSPFRFKAVLRRLLGLTVTSPIRTSVKSRKSNRFRPMLETCEDRTVPTISGNVYYDANANGVKGLDDIGASGVSVTLYQNDQWVTDTYTDAFGNYSFSETPTGNDVVLANPSYSLFAYNNTSATVVGGVGNIGLVGSGNEAGGRGAISGQLWYDNNANGVKDVNESSGLSGVQIELYYGGWSMGYTSTGLNGSYSFSGLWEGEYEFSITSLPSGSLITTPGWYLPEVEGGDTTTHNIGLALPKITVEKWTDGKDGVTDGYFRLTRTGDTNVGLTVYMNFSRGGTASNDVDYSIIAPTPVTFEPGSAYTYVSAAISDDSDSEPTETLVLTIQPSGNSDYLVGATNSATLNILDNDEAVVSVTKVRDAVESEDELDDEAKGIFRFTRTGNLSSSLTVNYTIDDSATDSDDYTALTGTATFEAGQATVEVELVALADNIIDPDESVSITLDEGTGYTIGSPSSATVNIEDDPPVVTVVSIANGTEGESDGTFRSHVQAANSANRYR